MLEKQAKSQLNIIRRQAEKMNQAVYGNTIGLCWEEDFSVVISHITFHSNYPGTI
ncbi:hypothetical protein QP921_08850 [Corynebacterium pseudodiphtheriticum]|uniref:hypothetical protein n=1 Tax=Corynebacterium pseudodiphtheriticum TaxID=37637 RepID=UPI00254FA10E|nr:hypothetical protein [Corynebacterium pseudodiphtheriticum]MDK8500578.1 hypothetical protein [Corynebacterium pseudodiphtheriticum]MDK8583618.1 hypothetical protein [Corynebacterium pseudodiphtheriticum]MDK8615026.1 hypothetical protein [Corynebacterium pseudodiphtheriticum]MDK8738839.1 hypothetical protein [Corynebacterium pseudodiphtheriticum]MDK8745381.1 hypothetical protein [Corynebacterium pseudodiphtheriticum]